MNSISPCADHERPAILAIVNAAAEAYRGAIPDDCWHEPYMPSGELDSEIAAGVAFWGYEADGALVGVMGIQPVRDVDLIRHAYVLPARQGQGIGGALLEQLRGNEISLQNNLLINLAPLLKPMNHGLMHSIISHLFLLMSER